MKRILIASSALVLTLLLTISLSSCLDGDSQIKDKLGPGKAMHYDAYFTNQIMFDPAILALRLNTLMVETKKEGFESENTTEFVSVKDMKNVVLGEEGNKFALYPYYFGTSEMEHLGAGVYKIKLTTSHESQVDNVMRTGTIIIDTKGKLLRELSERDSWEIYRADDVDGYSYAIPADAFKVILPKKDNLEMSYNIAGMGTNVDWSVDAVGVVIEYMTGTGSDKFNSKWNGNFFVKQKGTVAEDPKVLYSTRAEEAPRLPMDYWDIIESTYELIGKASGKPIAINFGGEGFHYDIITPIAMLGRCGWRFLGGVERVVVDQEISETLPDNTVTVTWEKGSGSSTCSSTISYRYNGQVGI